jgi:DNA-binding response OmpR family regulator
VSNHVLVVDDERPIRELVAEFLEEEGFPVETAADGAEALQAIERDVPGVMLLDMRMPNVDGWGVAARLKERGIKVPIVVMTAAENAQAWCDEIGADACLAKPFQLDALVATVGSLYA